jgi:hypothetical protein
MSYVNKRIQTLINHADACGAGSKKTGLVCRQDWARLTSSVLSRKTPANISFTARGTMVVNECCGQKATTNLHPSQRAYRNPRSAFN